MTEPKIKNCPFCGKEANYYEDEHMISCMDSKGGCDSYYNGLGFTKEELIKAWNNRHPEVSTHDIARAMQGVDFDINELVMLKGKKYQVISMSAGMKLAEAIVKELNDPRT